MDDAWGTYRGRLADRLATAAQGDQLVLETVCDTDESDGRVPFVQCNVVAGPHGPVVRCEIPSELQLPPRRRLTAADHARLVAQGWSAPAASTSSPAAEPEADEAEAGDDPALVVEKAPRWADQLAAMAVSVFRDTWAVPHPSFLSLHHLGSSVDLDVAPETTAAPRPTPLDRHVAIRPADTDHLREAIALTLTDIYGGVPERDSDGDFVLRFGSALALVIANDAAPEVQLWAPLVRDISGRTRASELVTDLNRRWPYLRFGLFEDRLRVMVDMLADPFVPQHLADMIEHLGDFLSGVDEEFAEHFGGRLHFPKPATTVGNAPAGTPAQSPAPSDPARESLPEKSSEQQQAADEPIQPSLFDDLDDQ